uniref:Cytochrome c oxidase subunit 3 n=1 Tax=Bathynella cf. rufa JHS-2017 TaxID=2029186 RepID=A0A7R6D8K8_9CRUS|nr:cytochrome oxidase subunit 3 [Bathynella cf. rufa JHS-2017]
MMKNNHPYHLVDKSPWPVLAAFSAFIIASGLISWFHNQNKLILIISLMTTLYISMQWWRDIIRESTMQGLHTLYVIKSMKIGMLLFILSEIMFFFSFFWAFFHSSMSPNIELGGYWPPIGITSFNPMEIPLLNTIVLLSSGASLTWAHHEMMNSEKSNSLLAMIITIILGSLFTLLQAMEYYEASFCINDSIYGTTFFMATGFHGLHVIIGTTFIIVCTFRMYFYQFSYLHHVGFEAAAWYWHFVDVVWLFLYISIYWWGGP